MPITVIEDNGKLYLRFATKAQPTVAALLEIQKDDEVDDTDPDRMIVLEVCQEELYVVGAVVEPNPVEGRTGVWI